MNGDQLNISSLKKKRARDDRIVVFQYFRAVTEKRGSIYFPKYLRQAKK